MSVTPIPGAAHAIVTGGVPVNAVLAGPNGGYILNPVSAADQGLGTAETLYVDPVGPATLQGNGTTVALAPGQAYEIIAGTTLPTSCNAATGGHAFVVVSY